MAVDINNATAEELAAGTGIDLDLAESIIEYRDEAGGFSSLEEIADIPGCDEQLVIGLRESGVNLGATAAEGSSDS